MLQTCLDTIPAFRFTEGTLQSINHDAVPRWATPALSLLRHVTEYDRALAMNDAICVESYGQCEEGIDVWHCQGAHLPEWCALYWSGNRLLAVIVICGVADFLSFQSTWLALMAQKIVAAEKEMTQ